MSISFNNTTGFSGLIQQIERNCGFSPGDISGNTTRLAQFTSDVNLALDSIWATIFEVGGTWQLDDSNFTDYPVITTNLVSGQRDYSFTTDGSGNVILEIYKVLVSDAQGNYIEINSVDQQGNAPINFLDGNNTTGQPNSYDKTGNGIFLDPIPNYNYANGLKLLINREASYFTVSDTTKKPGFAGIFHEYLALRPSYMYCTRNKMFDLAKSLKAEMLEMEDKIREHYAKRNKDEVKRLVARSNNTK
jgi:hypothetical protein